MTTTLRRLAMPVLGLAAAASFATACSSSTIGGTGVPGGSVGASSGGGSSSGDFGSGSASVPSIGSSGGGGVASSSDSGGGGSTGDAAFCTTFRTKLGTIQNAGSDPTTAADTFDALAAVAPPAIKADVQYVATALHQAFAGKVPDTTKIEQATERVTKYYVTNCH